LYVYHGRGLRFPLADDVPIACEPLVNQEDGTNIPFADGHVEWFDAERATTVLRSIQPTTFPATRPAR
jgi:prepilin-type processing-associated H-X9-DG protein